MRYCHPRPIAMAVVTLGALIILAQPAPAGIFSKHTKVNPAERVPALIATLRADSDEKKRSSAAEELKQYDPAQFPEIIPSLADAAQHDPKSGVRIDALQTLAKLRPVSQQAGAAIEQATHDDSVRVRFQARTLLWQYHLAGYHGSKTPQVGTPREPIYTEEPPLAAPTQLPAVSTIQKPVAPQPTVGFVSPAETPAPRSNVWGATTAPRTLSGQPSAIPMGPKPLPPASGEVRASAPQPLPTGPAKAIDSGPKPLPPGPAQTTASGPKPLPQGPVDIGKPIGDAPTKESSSTPPKDDGPELP